MVPTVRHHDVAVRSETEALGTVQRAAHSVDVGEERSELVEDLNPTVPPVRHQDVVLAVHGDSCRGVELAVTLPCYQRVNGLSSQGLQSLKCYHSSRN